MKGVLGHNSARKRYTGPRTTWANEMRFGANHAPSTGSTGSIARVVDLQSGTPPLCHGCPPLNHAIDKHETS